MKVVVRQRRSNFIGFEEAFIPVAIYHDKTVQEVAQELINQNEDLTIKCWYDEDGEASAEILKNGEVVGKIDIEN